MIAIAINSRSDKILHLLQIYISVTVLLCGTLVSAFAYPPVLICTCLVSQEFLFHTLYFFFRSSHEFHLKCSDCIFEIFFMFLKQYQIFIYAYNLGRNNWNKIKKYSKIWKDQKALISTFLTVFYYYCQSPIPERETGCYSMSPLNFEIFLIFRSFLRPEVSSRLAIYEETRIQSLLY